MSSGMEGLAALDLWIDPSWTYHQGNFSPGSKIVWETTAISELSKEDDLVVRRIMVVESYQELLCLSCLMLSLRD